MRERDISCDTTEPVAKLKRLEEFTTDEVHLLANFARFLADRLENTGRDGITPLGFIMTTHLAVYDLREGVDGFTHKPITGNLTGRTPEFYSLLEHNAPKLAEIAFPQEFASAVREEWEKLTTREADEIPSQAKEKTFDPDAIQEKITTINQADELILQDARKRILSLDWAGLGITDLEEVGKIFDGLSRLALRNSGMNFPLNILNAATPREQRILDSLPDNHKRHERGEFWLVMLSQTIAPEEATFIRDWLWLRLSESIIDLKELPVKQSLDHFTARSQPFEKASFRAFEYMSNTRGWV